MKKLFLIVLVILFAVNFSQAQTAQVHQYKGAVKLSGVQVDGTVTATTNHFKQDVLFAKSNQWLRVYYGNGIPILSVGNMIRVQYDDYTLFLKFKDGRYEYTFTDTSNKINKIEKTEQEVIDKLTLILIG